MTIQSWLRNLTHGPRLAVKTHRPCVPFTRKNLCRPSLERLRTLTGFKHCYTLEETIDDLVAIERLRMTEERDGHCTLVRHQSERAA